MAKTPYSFSNAPTLQRVPNGHVLQVREARLAAGAGLVVRVRGDIMTMPGLPAQPALAGIDLQADWRVTGLF